MDRRSALRRLGGALLGVPAAARAAQEQLTGVAVRAAGASSAVGSGAYGPPTSGAARPMPVVLKQLQKWLWKERNLAQERADALDAALIGRVPPYIAALKSVQVHTRARMHLRCVRESRLYDANQRLEAWWRAQQED